MTIARITVLGCGNSTGVPAIGDFWGSCDPGEPKNRRTRCSIAVQTTDTTLVVDTGPDFSAQLTAAKIPTVHGVLYTHAHSDHVNGMDELRILRWRNKALIPVYGNEKTLHDLQTRFQYIFVDTSNPLYPPCVTPHVINQFNLARPHILGDIVFTPFEQNHGSVKSLGYRFGNFGYSVDILDLDETALEALRGIDTWIVDGAAYNQTDNAVHANLKTLYRLNERIGASRVYVTSLTLGMDYHSLKRELRSGFEPAYDGLTFSITL